jgi:hypothetical protein
LALRLPKYPSKASGAGFALDTVGSPVLGAIKRPLENQRDKKGVGLMARTKIKSHNNQPEIYNSGRGDVGERLCGGWSMWGDVIPSFG